ncbi:hypothetical protein JYU14_03315 [Simkania negevensis]|uniref:Uncharacterized protein n=1 Tax=Simkania negevensis TaxID=83561 RepID=A0ABS3ART0_9BACT|nr:hypothetical protein [Simkania negevensis]
MPRAFSKTLALQDSQHVTLGGGGSFPSTSMGTTEVVLPSDFGRGLFPSTSMGTTEVVLLSDSGDTLPAEEVTGDTLPAEEVTGDTLPAEEVTGDTLSAREGGVLEAEPPSSVLLAPDGEGCNRSIFPAVLSAGRGSWGDGELLEG